MSRLQEWLSTYENKDTVKSYRWGIAIFLKHVYGDGDIEVLAERYLDDSRDHAKDLMKFSTSIKKRAPKSQTLIIGSVKVFLSEYDIELPAKFWRKFKRRRKGGSKPIHVDKIPNNAELRRIIAQMPIQGKALFRLLATSGARIGEVLALRLKDLKLQEEELAPHVVFRAATTKGGTRRVGFMTPEAKSDIEEWLKVRDEYLVTAASRSRYYKPVKDARLFPFSKNNTYNIWRNAVGKVGLLEKDERTNRYTVHPHVLRKWFRTRLGGAIQLDVVEALMGHEGYLTREYRRYSIEELSEFYLEGQEVLLLEVEVNAAKLNGKIRKQEEQLRVVTIDHATRIAEQKERLGLMEDKISLREQHIDTLEFEIEKLKSTIANLANLVAEKLEDE